jgi:hypothetical protein
MHSTATAVDAVRNNLQFSLLASAVRNASTQTATQTNYNARGVMLFLHVTANAATETLQVSVGQDIATSPSNIANFSALAAANGVCCYVVYPGAVETIAVASSLGMEVQALPLPRNWYVFITHSAGGNWQYSLTGCYIL